MKCWLKWYVAVVDFIFQLENAVILILVLYHMKSFKIAKRIALFAYSLQMIGIALKLIYYWQFHIW